MRFRILAAIAIAMALVLTATAAGSTTEQTAKRCPVEYRAPSFTTFAKGVWHLPKWEREKPKAAVLAHMRKQRRCAAGDGHRAAMSKTWRVLKRAFYRHRGNELFRERVTPYYGCTKLGICGWWAMPAYIVSCESGGLFDPREYTARTGVPLLPFGGAYGFLEQTWREWGDSRWPTMSDAPPKEQHKAASRLWRSGVGSWECA